MLNFEVSGKGSQSLVLLHGFLENLTIWEDMAPYFSKEFTSIKIDLPGHGKSKTLAEIQTMDLMAKEVKKVVDDLSLDQVHLVGHSMGGYTALAFAELFPEKIASLTLFFSTYAEDSTEKKEQRKKAIKIMKEAFPTYVNSTMGNLFNANELDILEAKIRLAKDIGLKTDLEGAIACTKGMIERPDRKKVLENADYKILLLNGRFDNAVNTKTTIDQLPEKTNIKAYILDCGHNGHWEKPSICAEIINTELLHNTIKNLTF